MRAEPFLSLALMVTLPGCGDPNCPAGYRYDRAAMICTSLDSGVDAGPDGSASRVEVCDSVGHDEDGDPTTLGPDHDGDGAASATCCNTQRDGALLCGTDCNDSDPTAHVGAVEACDGTDNDCDGSIDGLSATSWCSDASRLGPHASSAACASGSCVLTCTGEYLDCTADPGCETDGSAAADCGACGNRCLHASCASGVCALDYVEIAAGGYLTCARRGNGTVECWGDSGVGPLGAGGTPSPNPVVGVSNAVNVAAGYRHACAVRADGTVACWGSNIGGQLGDGTMTDRGPAAVDVVGLADAIRVTTGFNHSCALRRDGRVACWGSAPLGDGTATSRTSPVAVAGVVTAVDVAAGEDHTCVRLSDGSVECWGYDDAGQLGDGRVAVNEFSPVLVPGLVAVQQLSAGSQFGCARRDSGAVSCWGDDELGQLGDGATGVGIGRPSPVDVATLIDAAFLDVGSAHACVARVGGAAECWGANEAGQLGDGTTTRRSTPVSVGGLSNVVEISAGRAHTCARLHSGIVECWGAADHGQLGDGTMTPHITPVPVVDP